jgi:hypothetical protein
MTTQYLRLSLDTMLAPATLYVMHEYHDNPAVSCIVDDVTTDDIVEGYLFTREGFSEDEAQVAALTMMYALI